MASSMLKKSRLILLAVLFVIGFLGLVPASAAIKHKAPKKATRTTFEDLEQQWRLAELNSDVPAMDRLLSDDFVGITASGQINTKAQQLARLRKHSFALTQLDLSDVKVKIVGQVAIVTSLAEIKGSNDGTPLMGAFRYTRVYQRLPGGAWKITSSEATRIPKNHRNPDDAPPAS